MAYSPDQLALIHGQLDRVIASKTLRRATKPREFIQLSVKKTLEGREHELTTPLIGKRFYPNNKEIGNNVTNLANQARGKLAEYYTTLGINDQVEFSIPSGAYVAEILIKAGGDAPPPPRPRKWWLWVLVIVIAVASVSTLVIMLARHETGYANLRDGALVDSAVNVVVYRGAAPSPGRRLYLMVQPLDGGNQSWVQGEIRSDRSTIRAIFGRADTKLPMQFRVYLLQTPSVLKPGQLEASPEAPLEFASVTVTRPDLAKPR